MTTLHAPPATRVVLTDDDVRRWKAELFSTVARIKQLGEVQAELERKLAAAAMFIDVDSIPMDEGELDEDVDGSAQSMPPNASPNTAALPMALPPKRRRSRNGATWADVVLEAVSEAELGLTYAEIRKIAADSSLGSKLAQSDKGYHNAIGRLARSGEIIREHGRLFTPDAYKKFMEAVEAGEATTTVIQPLAYSPMGEAIMDIVAARPGELNGKSVITQLRLDPEHNATLTPHETGAYNIIARLVRREHLTRRDDGTLLPGPSFPRRAKNQGEEAPV